MLREQVGLSRHLNALRQGLLEPVGLVTEREPLARLGLRRFDEIVLGGNFQLMLATSGASEKAGHFHSDGTFHEGSH